MKPIRLILAMPFFALALLMIGISIVIDLIDLIGTAAAVMCAVIWGAE